MTPCIGLNEIAPFEWNQWQARFPARLPDRCTPVFTLKGIHLATQGRISPADRFLLWLYDVILVMGAVIMSPVLLPLISTSEKYRRTLFQRLWMGNRASRRGRCPASRVWIHALSVGEIMAASTLVANILDHDETIEIVFSVSTLSGFQTARRVFGRQPVSIIFFPYDFSFSVRAAVRWVRPCAVILTETDIWPNFLAEMKRRDVPVNLINLRLSDTTFHRYRKVKWVARKLFGAFSAICVQSAEDARRLARLGVDADRVHVTGNIKFDNVPAEKMDRVCHQWRKRLQLNARRKVVVAGSTHPADEETLFQAYTRLKAGGDRFLLVVAPRDPKRSDPVLALFRSRGIRCRALSGWPAQGSEKEPDVVVVDAFGVLKQLYALADVAFIGGSMGADGGHNPLEPAAWGKPIVFGPDMSDFRQIAAGLIQSGGARQVTGFRELIHALRSLLANGTEAEAMGRNALNVVNANQGAVRNTLVQLCVPKPLFR